MKNLLTLAAPLIILAACESNDKTTTTDDRDERGSIERANLSAGDLTFIHQAAIGGQFEVDSSRLALQQSLDRDSRDFAEMMVKDHTATNNQLRSLAQRKGATIPANLDSRHREMMESLQITNAASFSQAYRDLQLQAHREAIALFEQAASTVQDRDIRSFAQKNLPALRKHLEELQQMK